MARFTIEPYRGVKSRVVATSLSYCTSDVILNGVKLSRLLKKESPEGVPILMGMPLWQGCLGVILQE